MSRRLLFVVILILFIAGGTYLYFTLSKLKAPVSHAYSAIPSDASIVIATNGSFKTFRDLQAGNKLWQQLSLLPEGKKVSLSLEFLDSLIKSNSGTEKIFQQKSFLFSFHSTASSWLLTTNVNDLKEFEQVEKWLAQLKNINIQQESEQGYFTARYKNTTLFFLMRSGVISITDNKELRKQSFESLSSGKSILTDKEFSDLKETVGADASANVFINYARLSNLLSKSLSESVSPGTFAGWSALDLKHELNSFQFSGFTSFNENHTLALFEGQEAVATEVFEVIPSNISTIKSLRFTDRERFIASVRKNKTWEHPDENEVSSHLLSWINNEVTVFTGTENSLSTIVAIGSDDIEETAALLSSIRDTSYTDSLNTGQSGKLRITNHLRLFGNLFSNVKENYYFIAGDYVLFANSFDEIRSVANELERKHVLSEDADFKEFIASFDGEANYFAFVRIPALLKKNNIFNENAQTYISSNDSILRDFRFSAISLKKKEKFFYTSGAILFRPQTYEQPSTIWETELDTAILSKPYLIKDHISGGYSVLIQDALLNLYLISSTGELLWKKKMEQQINDDATYVDALKNERYQTIFSSGNKIHCIDRNGNNLPGFPIELNSDISSGITILDYDNTRDYRILSGCKNGMVYNHTMSGEEVEGWKFKSLEYPIEKKPAHTMIAGKDQIVVCDSAGNLISVDRKGQPRTEKFEIGKSPLSEILIEQGSDMKTSFIVFISADHFVKCSFTGKLEVQKLSDTTITSASTADLTGDNKSEIMLTKENMIEVIDSKARTLFRFNVDSGSISYPAIIEMTPQIKRLGILVRESSEIFILDSRGIIERASPLDGEVPFVSADLTNSGELILITGKGKKLLAYSLPHFENH